MLKKTIFASMISALMFSSSGSVFAMEEDHDKQISQAQKKFPYFSDSVKEDEDRRVLAAELEMGILSLVSGADLLKNVSLVSRKWHDLVKGPFLKMILAQTFPNGNLAKKISSLTNPTNAMPISESDAEYLSSRFQEAVIKHKKHGFTFQFITKIFNPDIIHNRLQENMWLSIDKCVAFCFPLNILEADLEDGQESSTVSLDKKRYLQEELTALFERHPIFQKYEGFPCLNYESHFKTIFRFMQGMSKEQQARTISLLSPHLERKNFGNFYTYKFVEGVETFDLGDLNGEGKIEWLGGILKAFGYLDNASFYEK